MFKERRGEDMTPNNANTAVTEKQKGSSLESAGSDGYMAIQVSTG